MFISCWKYASKNPLMAIYPCVMFTDPSKQVAWNQCLFSGCDAGPTSIKQWFNTMLAGIRSGVVPTDQRCLNVVAASVLNPGSESKLHVRCDSLQYWARIRPDHADVSRQLKGLAQAKIIKKSVIFFRVLNMTI